MSKELWYAWPRDKLARLIINSSEEAEKLAAIVRAYPYAKTLIEKRITMLNKAINLTEGQATYKINFGIALATEAQLLREVLSAADQRTYKEVTDYVRPQED